MLILLKKEPILNKRYLYFLKTLEEKQLKIDSKISLCIKFKNIQYN